MDCHDQLRVNTLIRDESYLEFFQEHGLKAQTQLAEMLGWTRARISQYFDRHAEIPRKRRGDGPQAGRWNGGRIVDKDGYVLLL